MKTFKEFLIERKVGMDLEEAKKRYSKYFDNIRWFSGGRYESGPIGDCKKCGAKGVSVINHACKGKK